MSIRRGGLRVDIDESFVIDHDAYHLTLAGLALPWPLHCLFNALGAASLYGLGHPLLAVVSFLALSAIDAGYQSYVGRELSAPPPANAAPAFTRLAVTCFLRNAVLIAPATFIALSGGAAQLVYLGVLVCLLVMLAGHNGALSRKLFYAYAVPPAVALVAVVLTVFAGPSVWAILIGVLTLAVLLVGASQSVHRAVSVLRLAFQANQRLVVELEEARDRALAERAAADEAREAARRANAAKSNFLATMSHEIRTPMNGVLGMAQLLRRDEADPRQIERLDTLVESGEYLLSILNDILDVSKIDAGRLEIAPKPEDLPRFLGQVVEFWGARADEKGLTLRLDVTEAVPRGVLMDALRLRQVLFNLVGNALKFTETGSVTLVVDAEPAGEGASRVRIAVSDTGPGIDPQHLAVLFDRFAQGEEDEARRYGGTGLGLAIAKQLTELMGGRIWVQSTPGEGATFRIELPLAHAAVEPPAEDQASAQSELGRDELQLLIVDDNAVNLLVLEQLLAAFGHRCAKASSGREALDLLARDLFDLVLMDIQMPQMTGVEALRLLRAEPGPNRDVPVIALTADVTSGGRSRYLDLGFSEHTAKPVQLADLMQAIGRAMDAPEQPAATLAQA